MTQDKLDELQSDVMDLRATPVKDLADALECAETCETVRDFVANIDEAIERAQAILETLRTIRKATR